MVARGSNIERLKGKIVILAIEAMETRDEVAEAQVEKEIDTMQTSKKEV